MRFFRSIFFYIILILSTMVMGIITIAGSFIHKGWPIVMARIWGGLNLWTAGVKVRVRGLENIDRKGPYIFASNHQGWFDIFAALNKMPISFSWLAKEELFRIPILGRAMRATGYIPIDRGDRRKALVSMNKAAETIRRGTSVFIFPEGTRSPDGVLREFKKGGFVLAAKSRQPIVPISISGSYRILPKNSWMIQPGEITFIISEPVAIEGTDGRSRDILLEKVREKIRSNLSAEEAGGASSGEAEPAERRHGGTSSGNV